MKDVADRDLAYFADIPQRLVTSAGYVRPTPAFFYDFSEADVLFATPLDRIREVLPSRRLFPLRLSPRSGVTMLQAFHYRDTDFGPFDEVMVGFPVSVDENAPVTNELRRFMARGGSVFIWQLPVTTDIAREVGAEVAGFRRFTAQIDFHAEGGLVTCRVGEGSRHILTLRLRHRPPTRREQRVRYPPVTVRGASLVRSGSIIRVREEAVAFDGRGVELELGDHPLVDDLRRLRLGRVIKASYAPANQAVLSSPLESWPLD